MVGHACRSSLWPSSSGGRTCLGRACSIFQEMQGSSLERKKDQSQPSSETGGSHGQSAGRTWCES